MFKNLNTYARILAGRRQIMQTASYYSGLLSSSGQHLSYDGCLEVRGRLSELFCVVPALCAEVVHSHKHT